MEDVNLNVFIKSLISKNDKLIQMGIIRSSKDLDLVARGDKVANDKGKQRDESPMKKEQSKEPSGLKISKKNGKGKVLCSYCGRGFHSERSCMRRQLDEMDLLLKKHTFLYLLAQGRMTLKKKKMKKTKGKAMH